MGRLPWVLVSSPLQPSHEEDHADYTEDATNEIDSADHFLLRQTLRVDSGWREIEEEGHEESDGSPNAAEKTAVPPSGFRSDELAPEHRGTEWNNGENQHGNVFSTLAGWCQLGSSSEGRQLIDAGADTC